MPVQQPAPATPCPPAAATPHTQQPPFHAPQDDEFLLMATDGLWDCMPPADAIQYARKQFKQGKSAQQVRRGHRGSPGVQMPRIQALAYRRIRTSSAHTGTLC